MTMNHRRIARARQKHHYREVREQKHPIALATTLASTLGEKASSLKTSSSAILHTLKGKASAGVYSAKTVVQNSLYALSSTASAGLQNAKSTVQNNLNRDTVNTLVNYSALFYFIDSAFANHADHVPKEQCDPYNLDGVCLAFMFHIVVNGVKTPVHGMMSYYRSLMLVHDPKTNKTSFPPAIGDFIHNATAQCVEFCTHPNITYTTRCILQGWEFDPSRQPRYFPIMATRAGASPHELDECKAENGTSLVRFPNSISACLTRVAWDAETMRRNIQQTLHDAAPSSDQSNNGWGWGGIILGLAGVGACCAVVACRGRIADASEEAEVIRSSSNPCIRLKNVASSCFVSVCSFFRGLCEHQGSSGRVRKLRGSEEQEEIETEPLHQSEDDTTHTTRASSRPSSRQKQREPDIEAEETRRGPRPSFSSVYTAV